MNRMKKARAPAAMNMRIVMDLKLLPSIVWMAHVESESFLPAIFVGHLILFSVSALSLAVKPSWLLSGEKGEKAGDREKKEI